MCGRFTLSSSPERIAQAFELPDPLPFDASYNIAPTQPVAAVRRDPDSGARRCDLMRWGLVPSWAKDPSIGNRMINARAETVAEKPAFRHAFRRKRCLVIADGFYEWKREGSRKQAYFIRLKDGSPFGFAGLWDYWEGPDGAFESCSIITTEPNALMEPIHDRMPVIVANDAYGLWLSQEVQEPERLEPLLVPFPAEAMEAWPVSTMVNRPANNRPECIRPLG
ncbi:SOS response-associated peptidase [Tautonia rosea]|uniref:SOS response-associated peptidase n=1 Tax=Tautonia rosea TaxID=2728037 RepID=UPI001475F028|nr:SOS response-associated peptidase [Tautonia rosea]